jgi:hypothetical protein
VRPAGARRALTDSLPSIALIEKCWPTSRRNSSIDIGAVHSRLSTISAPTGPSSKSRKRSICRRMRVTRSATTSAVIITRSAERPVGSPMKPVAPPARASGRWPESWKRRSASSGTRLPTCRLSAVGSKPQ